MVRIEILKEFVEGSPERVMAIEDIAESSFVVL
jgi:hypothetical protein